MAGSQDASENPVAINVVPMVDVILVDAAATVPWKHVVKVIDLAKAAKIDKIEFAAGRDYEAPSSRK